MHPSTDLEGDVVIAELIRSLQEFTSGLPEALTWLGVVLAGAVPFVESYVGSVLGVAAGLQLPVAVAAAVVGNAASMVALVAGASAVRDRASGGRRGVGSGGSDSDGDGDGGAPGASARRQRLRRLFDRFGVPGVSLLGQTVLPSQLTASAMVGFGASKRTVIAWQLVSIVVWGLVFGVMAATGIGRFAS